MDQRSAISNVALGVVSIGEAGAAAAVQKCIRQGAGASHSEAVGVQVWNA